MPRRAGLSLVEVVVALALLAGAVTLIGSALLGAHTQAATGIARLDALERARRAAERVVAELRDLNLHPADLEPDVPVADSALSYRVVAGYASGAVELAPARSSGLYRRVALLGAAIVLQVPGRPDVVIADGVEDLELTLTAGDRLTVKVTASRMGPDGVKAYGIEELTVLLRNGT